MAPAQSPSLRRRQSAFLINKRLRNFSAFCFLGWLKNEVPIFYEGATKSSHDQNADDSEVVILSCRNRTHSFYFLFLVLQVTYRMSRLLAATLNLL